MRFSSRPRSRPKPSQKVRDEAEIQLAEDREASKVARWQAQNTLDEARKEARELTSKARKEAKERKEKAEEALNSATRYALEIRQKAEQRAKEIAGEAYEAKGKLKDYRASAQALENRIEKYEGVYLVPPTHILDELAEEFGFSKAGERLKLARERTRLMQQNGTAATCGIPTDGRKTTPSSSSSARSMGKSTPYCRGSGPAIRAS